MILFKNASVFDGISREMRKTDVLTDGSEIVCTGRIDGTVQSRVIDCSGLVLCPGFMDIHAHSELEILRDPLMSKKIMQGITFDLSGNCGVGVYPRKKDDSPVFADILGHYDKSWHWTDFESYRCAVRSDFNSEYLQSHANLRFMAINGNPNRPASEEEISVMCSLLEKSLDQGCIGFSSGLYYAPNIFASDYEIIRLLETVKKHDAVFCVHHRCEGSDVLASIDEILSYALRTGVKTEISHLKVIGMKNQCLVDRVLEKIHAAREKGADVAFDQYPYEYGSTSLFSLLPPSVLRLEKREMSDFLGRCSVGDYMAESVIKEIENPEGWDSLIQLCGFENITAQYLERHPCFNGKNLAEIADMMNINPYYALFRILSDETLALMTDVTQSRDSLVRIMNDSLMCFGTDALYTGEHCHPRSGNAAIHLLSEFCLKNNDIGLGDCIRKMTYETASRLGIKRRGAIREGYYADLVVFNPETLSDNSDASHPFAKCSGLEYVFVNGKEQNLTTVSQGSRSFSFPDS